MVTGSPTSLLGHPVVENFDVLLDDALGLRPCCEAAVEDPRCLQRAPEAFHRPTVPTITLATHGGAHAKLLEHGLVIVRAVLAAPIGVVQQSRRRAPASDGAKCRRANPLG